MRRGSMSPSALSKSARELAAGGAPVFRVMGPPGFGSTAIVPNRSAPDKPAWLRRKNQLPSPRRGLYHNFTPSPASLVSPASPSGKRPTMLIGQQLGPFKIDRELGSGAMGTV